MSKLTIELDERRSRVLEEAAAKEHVSKTVILERMLDRLGTAPPSPTAEASGDVGQIHTIQDWLTKYAGTVTDLPPDYASNPKYLNDLGKV